MQHTILLVFKLNDYLASVHASKVEFILAEGVHYIGTLSLLPQAEKGCPYENLPFLVSSAAKLAYGLRAGQGNMNQSDIFPRP